MADQMIRDKIGRIVGYYRDKTDRIVLLDAVRREVGYYDKKRNETWKSYPRELISREGNVLAMLINQNGGNYGDSQRPL